LNELIAAKRGVEFFTTYVNTDDKPYSKLEPDYCNSWQWAGELLESIYEKNLHINIRFRNKANVDADFSHGNYHNDKIEVEVCSPNIPVMITTNADSPTRAISEAWYLMECEK
jgi:hypothetical protein